MNRSPSVAPPPWHETAAAACARLGVDPERGIDPAEAGRRRRRYGANVLLETPPRSLGSLLAAQFRSLVVALLAAAAAMSVVVGEWVEAIAIAAVLVINTAIGFVAELRAVRSMEALRRLGSVRTRVRRGGEERAVTAAELVPGDVVLLEAGDLVPADLRLLEASRVEADESALTGESVPVAKATEPVAAETTLAERRSMLFRGTALTRGSGSGVVVATGPETELGRVAELAAAAAGEEETPLEARLERLGRRLIWATLAVAALTVGIGLAAGRELVLMVETGIALAVAAVPEGLPIVATLALARGMWRMARRNALVRRLAAVETLGSTTLIVTDKTGTLTENRLTAVRLELAAGAVEVEGGESSLRGRFVRAGEALDPASDDELGELLLVASLCNNAALGEDPAAPLGDPLEVALLVAAARGGLERERLIDEWPEVGEEPFESSTQRMATIHARGAERLVAVKGAPEAVLAASSSERRGATEVPLDDVARERWQARNRAMAEGGLRVLGLAERRMATDEEARVEQLTFLGLVGLLDPPRAEIRSTLADCRTAGLRVVMATGDQAPTAIAVARAVGLVDEAPEVIEGRELRELRELTPLDPATRERLRRVPIFARVDPEQKLELLALHQEAGEIVAMTGDGVNDAPALERADIGIAMGRRGTQVAQEAADMVLRDDRFATLVEAIAQGRVIFANIRRFVVYLMSCNASEILVVALALPFSDRPPLLPLQILFLNLVTDVFPALALALGEGSSEVMRRPPRDPLEEVLMPAHWRAIAGFGLLLTAAVLGAFFTAVALDWPAERVVTTSFLTLALAQLAHVVNLRHRSATVFDNQIVRNRWMLGALGLCLLLLAAAVRHPGLAAVLGVVDPGRVGWALAGGFAALPVVLGRLVIGWRRGPEWREFGPGPTENARRRLSHSR